MDEWKSTRILIIDEISFMSTKQIIKLNQLLQEARENYKEIFGGLDIVFSGDFSQLDPIISNTKDGTCGPLYRAKGRARQLWQGSINCYIELKGLHRFEDDKEWGLLLRRLREGRPTREDLIEINNHVVTKETKIPDNILYGVRFNKLRDSIHNSLFEKYISQQNLDLNGRVKDCLIIVSDNMKLKNSGEEIRNIIDFYQNVGEADCKVDHGRIDPMLKIYPNGELMLVKNTDVRKGKANGTRFILHQVILQPESKCSTTIIRKRKVNIINASHVKCIIVKTKESTPKTFEITPEKIGFKARIPIPMKIKKGLTNSKKTEQLVRMEAT